MLARPPAIQEHHRNAARTQLTAASLRVSVSTSGAAGAPKGAPSAESERTLRVPQQITPERRAIHHREI